MRGHHRRQPARLVRAALVILPTVVIGGAILLGAGGVSQARTGSQAGFVATDTCSSVVGQLTYSPGFKLNAVNQEGVLLGTTSGCSDIFSGSESGTGTFTASLTGKSKFTAQSWSGTFTVDWPPSSGYNPSVGNLTITESGGLLTVVGMVTSGFDTGSTLGMQYQSTSPVVGQGTPAFPYTGQVLEITQPLTLSRDE